MFYYVFSLVGDWDNVQDCDDIRVVENREEALMFRKMLVRTPMKVVCK